MVNYSKGIIYKLCCNDPNIKEIYVGSTTNFSRRKSGHKSYCNNPNNNKYNYRVYKFIRDNGGWCNWSMVLVREYNATNKMKLVKKERKYIDKLKATLNCQIPTRTQSEYNKEYNETNKETKREKNQQYHEANKQAINEKNKQYRHDNKQYLHEKIKCECGCEVSRNHISGHKKTQKHKDLMNEQ
jgi:hypothetical protein